jgi:peptidoglycan hydrolase-like protein with peptidoglycan-binding domain
MKRTLLSLVGAAMLAGTSAVALAQTGMTPSNPQQNMAPGAGAHGGAMSAPGAAHMGMSPDRVKEIQSALDQKGQHVTVDGKWGKQTASALRKFQQENGLKPTGRLDPETAQKLGLPASG